MSDLVRIWYVSSQRLCNYHCQYCVSIGDYAKSNTYDWRRERDRGEFEAIVRWLGSRPFPVGVRLATLGEPFASLDFLAQAAWLTQQPCVRFVELLTNGSLLRRRLPRLAEHAELRKLSLWISFHHTETTVERLLDSARFAHEQHGCFVVVNGLLFPDNVEKIAELRSGAVAARLRFNLDLGYDPHAETGTYGPTAEVVPFLKRADGLLAAQRLGVNPDLLRANLVGMNEVHGQPCSAGYDYLYIGIDGDVYPCSRYYVLKHGRLGNVLDPDFQLNLRELRFAGCHAPSGCCNKEDFLNLQLVGPSRRTDTPSLGWLGR